jgi:superfamily II DNA or RNA helicase
MPTGTGKTDVMVATTIASSCRTVLVVVPSDALRSQTAAKFQSLGVLRAIGVIPEQAQYPVVGTLRHIPKEDADLEVFDHCNVIVATMSALSGATGAVLDQIAARCTHLFIDEAHHAPADTWNDLRERFVRKLVLQFTATPFRRDGRRMEGRILYNYPLAKAQEDGYFQAIRFIPVWEWDDEEADRAVAEAAVKCIREDLAAGFDHLLMARVDSIERAEQIYAELYAQHADLNPVVIHNGTKERRKGLSDIVIDELKHGAQSPEDAEKTAQECSEGAGPTEVMREKQADQAKPDKHENNEKSVRGENLANDRRDLCQVFAVMKFGRQEEVGRRRDEL